MILQGFRNASHYESQTVLQQGADDEKTEKSVAWCAVFVLWIFGALLLLNMEFPKIAAGSSWFLH